MIALPTSATVAVLRTRTTPGVGIDLDLGRADAHLPEDGPLGVRAGAGRRDLAVADQLAAGEPEAAGHQARDRVRLDRVAGRDLLELGPHARGRTLNGEAGERRRAARAGRAVVGREPRVGPADRDLLGRHADLLGGDLREHRAGALPDLGRADEHDRVRRRPRA